MPFQRACSFCADPPQMDPSESAGIGGRNRGGSLGLFMPGSNVMQQTLLCRRYSGYRMYDVNSVTHLSYLWICTECAVRMYVRDFMLPLCFDWSPIESYVFLCALEVASLGF